MEKQWLFECYLVDVDEVQVDLSIGWPVLDEWWPLKVTQLI